MQIQFEPHSWLGPIVRINPNEIHIHDPEWLDVLYVRAPKVGLRSGLSAW